MATSNERVSAIGSPTSSEELESPHCTPATKASLFSPEETRHKSKPAGFGGLRSKIPPAFTLTAIGTGIKSDTINGDSTVATPQDPFTSTNPLTGTTHVLTDNSKLSPNASAFTPGTLFWSESSNAASSTLTSIFSLAGQDNVQGTLALSTGGVMTIHHGTGPHTHTIPTTPVSGVIPAGLPKDPFPQGANADQKNMNLGCFSYDTGTSRCLMAGPLVNGLTETDVKNVFDINHFSSQTQLYLNDLALTGRVYIKFADIRDAENAYAWVDSQWNARYISSLDFATKTRPDDLRRSPVSLYEGQVMIIAEFTRSPDYHEIDATGKFISTLVAVYGTVMAFDIRPVTQWEVSYRMEFCDLRAIEKALINLRYLKFDNCTLKTSLYQPDLNVDKQHPLQIPEPSTPQRGLGFEDIFRSMTLNHHGISYASAPQTPSFSSYNFSSPSTGQFPFRKYPHEVCTPSLLRNFSGSIDQHQGWNSSQNPYSELAAHSPIWAPYSPGTIGQERGTPTPQRTRPEYYGQHRGSSHMTVRRPYDNPSTHHNVVDIAKIRQGGDVRTTIMLRNIPNKIDQAMLKEIVDETSEGKYDFMYLRIDFANNCNVGYAFINFEDPFHIIGFVQNRAGQRWYNSDKVAEVSYATIQGKDCLIQKFRNSSVMLEHPSFRPKIFYTSGPLSGQEEAFPVPDNASKMRRSVENAAHVGLFAPRAGQSFRDEQRRRRSQYDRGTRLAEIEDSYPGHERNFRMHPNTFHQGGPYGPYNTLFYPALPGFGSTL